MEFRVTGLGDEAFRRLYGLSAGDMGEAGAIRYVADAKPGFPCRVSLRDAEPGETLLLLNFLHQPAATPYQASHAIFVIEGSTTARPAPGEVPDMLARRELAVRAFDADHMMTDAVLTPGQGAAATFRRLLADPRNHYLQVHNAARGCCLASVERA